MNFQRDYNPGQDRASLVHALGTRLGTQSDQITLSVTVGSTLAWVCQRDADINFGVDEATTINPPNFGFLDLVPKTSRAYGGTTFGNYYRVYQCDAAGQKLATANYSNIVFIQP